MDSTHVSSPARVLSVFPPERGPLQRHTHTYDLLRQCIHCGFCLPTCPTYAVLGVEMDSPRGRIYQMQAVADGKLGVTDDFVEHMYCCVGCRACETACPSGVQFGKLIEAAREQIQISTARVSVQQDTPIKSTEEFAELPPSAGPLTRPSFLVSTLRRFFFSVLLPSRLALTIVFAGLKFYQRSGLKTLVHWSGLFERINGLPTPFQGKLRLPEDLVDLVKGAVIPKSIPEVAMAIGSPRRRVSFIRGCIMDQVFHNINKATIRVLTAHGCEVITPSQQNCCGALHVHAGEAERARMLARQNIDAFEQYHCDAIIINSAGCGSTLKEYDHLLRDDPLYAQRAKGFSQRVKDISEFLMTFDTHPPMSEIRRTVAYHDACHLLHGQKIRQQPRQLLASIPGVTLVELQESDWCCGSAGVYNITHQKMAQQLLDHKMLHIRETGATTLATGNPGCLLQIAMGARQQGLQLDVVHPVQLLDEAYQKAGVYDAVSLSKGKRQRTMNKMLLYILIISLPLFILFKKIIQDRKPFN